MTSSDGEKPTIEAAFDPSVRPSGEDEMKRYACALLAVGALFGMAVPSCGGGGDEPDDMSPQGVCAFYAERDCSGLERCYGSEIKNLYNDGATCRDRLAQFCVLRITATGTSETSSRVVACAKAVAQLSCDQYFDYDRWPDTCALPSGMLPDGAGCVAASQCQGGSCPILHGDRCGTCKTVSRVGGSCTSAVDCLDFMPCVGGVCAPHPSLGEPCDSAERLCINGLICRNFDASGLGACERLLSAGAQCDPMSPAGEECDYTQSLACDPVTSTCKAANPLVGVGEACSDSVGCTIASFCNVEGVCQARPREGEPCVLDQVDCLSPAKCVDGVCARPDPAACR